MGAILQAATMGRRSIASMALAIALGTLSACASAPSPTPVRDHGIDAARYLPLAVGNRWTYVVEVGGQVQEKELVIESEREGYHRDNHGGGLRVDSEGIRDEDRYLLLGPIEVGQRWESRLAGGGVERYEIIATDAVVEVPAGRFEEVIQVRGETRLDPQTELEVEWSWAPGVGIIRIRTTAIAGEGERIPQPTVSLQGFEIGEADAR